MKSNYTILEVKDLSSSYGEHKVLDGLNLHINQGEIVMIVGANGAGKSTLLKAIFGLIQSHGTIKLEGRIIKFAPHQMVASGICFVPQNSRVFPEMSVEENLRIGAFVLNDKKLEEERLLEVYEVFPLLKKKRKNRASELSGGEAQIVALGRSLMLKPKLLFLDEPSIGLAPKIVKEVFEKIVEINHKYKSSIVIVEHNLKTLLEIADRALILVKGKIAKEGKPKELLDSKILEEVFFGDLA